MPMHDATITLTVEARIVGQRKPPLTPWRVALPTALLPHEPCSDQPFRLRELLSHVVCEEVAAFRQRQEERRLARVLSPAQIEQAAASGKVAMGGPDESLPVQPANDVDEGAAVAMALQAFKDGLYFVFLDGQQYHDLDALVHPQPDSALTFIRLVALAGG